MQCDVVHKLNEKISNNIITVAACNPVKIPMRFGFPFHNISTLKMSFSYKNCFVCPHYIITCNLEAMEPTSRNENGSIFAVPVFG